VPSQATGRAVLRIFFERVGGGFTAGVLFSGSGGSTNSVEDRGSRDRGSESGQRVHSNQ
jgi:hypothetical protein